MPLTTEQKEALFKAARTSLKKQSEVQSENTNVEKLAPFVAEMLFTAGDLTVDIAKSAGQLKPTQVGTFIVNRVAGLTGLSESEKVQCFGALLGAATSAADLVGVVGVIGVTEVATSGVATPAVATISIPMLLSSSAAAALSAAQAHQQCGPLVSKFFQDRQSELLDVYMQFNSFVGNPAP